MPSIFVNVPLISADICAEVEIDYCLYNEGYGLYRVEIEDWRRIDNLPKHEVLNQKIDELANSSDIIERAVDNYDGSGEY